MEAGIYNCSRRNHKFKVRSGLLIPEAAKFYLRTGRCKQCWDESRTDTIVYKVRK